MDQLHLQLHSNEVRTISRSVNTHCAGTAGEFFDPREDGVNEIHMNYVSLEDDMLNGSSTELNRTQTLEIADLAGGGIDVGRGGQILVTDVIAFVVLKFDPTSDKSWSVPDPPLWEDLINNVLGYIVEHGLPCGQAYRWANLWGRVGLLGLSPKKMDLVHQYRKVIELQRTGNIRFTIFPKDGLEKRGNLSVLLRDNHRALKVEWLPKALLMRSRMRGGLRVTHEKTYKDTDFTRNGTSKQGWRLVLLQGCPIFMKSLEKYDQEHRFPVGAGHVLIRGGTGRPRSRMQDGRGRTEGRGPAQGTSIRPQQLRQQHQQHHHRQEARQRGWRQPPMTNTTRRNDADDSYDRDFPPPGSRNRNLASSSFVGGGESRDVRASNRGSTLGPGGCDTGH